MLACNISKGAKPTSTVQMTVLQEQMSNQTTAGDLNSQDICKLFHLVFVPCASCAGGFNSMYLGFLALNTQ